MIKKVAIVDIRYLSLLISVAFVFCFSCGKNKQKIIERAQIHYRMALDLHTKGETTQALAQALKAERLNTKDSETHNLLGLLYLDKKTYDKSEKHLQKAVELDEEYSEARNNLCYLYIEKNMFDEAIEQGIKAVENITYISPERAYNNIGWAYYKKGDVSNAVSYFNKSLLHNKSFFLPHMHLASIHFESGNYKEAKKEYEASIRGCKECTELYYRLGMTLLKLKDRKGALRVFEECKSVSKGGGFGEKCANKLAILK